MYVFDYKAIHIPLKHVHLITMSEHVQPLGGGLFIGNLNDKKKNPVYKEQL